MSKIQKEPYVIIESARGFAELNLVDKLFSDNREIFLTGEVDAESCNNLITRLIYLDRCDPDKEITLYINSPGGVVTDGLAVYDLINIIQAPVRTVCTGTCASMGAILFLAGEKREMTVHGRLMIHDPYFSGGYSMGGKKRHEIQSELDYLNRGREALAKIIAEKCGKTLDEVYAVTANDTYFNADEAVEFGLATSIITSQKSRKD